MKVFGEFYSKLLRKEKIKTCLILPDKKHLLIYNDISDNPMRSQLLITKKRVVKVTKKVVKLVLISILFTGVISCINFNKFNFDYEKGMKFTLPCIEVHKNLKVSVSIESEQEIEFSKDKN